MFSNNNVLTGVLWNLLNWSKRYQGTKYFEDDGYHLGCGHRSYHNFMNVEAVRSSEMLTTLYMLS